MSAQPAVEGADDGDQAQADRAWLEEMGYGLLQPPAPCSSATTLAPRAHALEAGHRGGEDGGADGAMHNFWRESWRNYALEVQTTSPRSPQARALFDRLRLGSGSGGGDSTSASVAGGGMGVPDGGADQASSRTAASKYELPIEDRLQQRGQRSAQVRAVAAERQRRREAAAQEWEPALTGYRHQAAQACYAQQYEARGGQSAAERLVAPRKRRSPARARAAVARRAPSHRSVSAGRRRLEPGEGEGSGDEPALSRVPEKQQQRLLRITPVSGQNAVDVRLTLPPTAALGVGGSMLERQEAWQVLREGGTAAAARCSPPLISPDLGRRSGSRRRATAPPRSSRRRWTRARSSPRRTARRTSRQRAGQSRAGSPSATCSGCASANGGCSRSARTARRSARSRGRLRLRPAYSASGFRAATSAAPCATPR